MCYFPAVGYEYRNSAHSRVANLALRYSINISVFPAALHAVAVPAVGDRRASAAAANDAAAAAAARAAAARAAAAASAADAARCAQAA